MAYNERLAARIRELMPVTGNAEEKEMMGGLTFMYNDKMCVGIFKDQLMCRIDPDRQEELLEKDGATIMEFGGRRMNGYLIVPSENIRTKQKLAFWIGCSLEFNKKAKSSKKKSSSAKKSAPGKKSSLTKKSPPATTVPSKKKSSAKKKS